VEDSTPQSLRYAMRSFLAIVPCTHVSAGDRTCTLNVHTRGSPTRGVSLRGHSDQ
jgi:hypothetical protein